MFLFLKLSKKIGVLNYCQTKKQENKENFQTSKIKCPIFLNRRFNITGEWFQFGRKQGINFAEKEKLVAPEISFGGNFAYDKNGDFYSTTKVYGYIKKSTVNESYLFWLGLFNSKLFWYFIQQTGYVLRGGYYTFKTNYILPFPIPKTIAPEISSSVEKLVKNILMKKQTSSKNDTQKEEREIDNLIYKLYELTAKEISEIGN